MKVQISASNSQANIQNSCQGFIRAQNPFLEESDTFHTAITEHLPRLFSPKFCLLEASISRIAVSIEQGMGTQVGFKTGESGHYHLLLQKQTEHPCCLCFAVSLCDAAVIPLRFFLGERGNKRVRDTEDILPPSPTCSSAAVSLPGTVPMQGSNANDL